ncbi:hypothetical protein WMF11_25120 [Sorangium sp. So ce295]|uniref:hypothetical protein n=1 Tax=Sorangium sp. So ce295 TaxID=3133295 RepID=UPI003F5E1A56
MRSPVIQADQRRGCARRPHRLAGPFSLAPLAPSLRTATGVLGRPDFGRLAAGTLADVLMVDSDATADVRALERVSRVYKSGVLLDRDALTLPRGATVLHAGWRLPTPAADAWVTGRRAAVPPLPSVPGQATPHMPTGGGRLVKDEHGLQGGDTS